MDAAAAGIDRHVTSVLLGKHRFVAHCDAIKRYLLLCQARPPPAMRRARRPPRRATRSACRPAPHAHPPVGRPGGPQGVRGSGQHVTCESQLQPSNRAAGPAA